MWLRGIKQIFAARRERRALGKVSRYSLDELVEDVPIRVVGRARPHGPALQAPLSQRVCVCYAIVVYDWHWDGSVRIVHTRQARAPFMLEDEYARVLVDPDRAKLSAEFDYTNQLPPWQDRLSMLGVRERDWSQTDILDVDEAIIELDEQIAVIGTAMREPDTDAAPASYRDGDIPLRWRLVPTTISDDPRLCR